jgi:hypothetical protein
VVISRDGQPVVELRAIPPPPRPVTQVDLEWIDAHRVGKAKAGLDAADVRRRRDEAEFWECVSADAWDDLG